MYFITHGAIEAIGVRNFWHLSAKILYTVEPKTATFPMRFISRLRPHLRKKKTSLLHVSVLSYFKIVEIIGPNTQEIIWSASFAWIRDNLQAFLKGIFSWVCFLPFDGKHRSWTVRKSFYIHTKEEPCPGLVDCVMLWIKKKIYRTKERKINNRCFGILSKRNIIVPLILDINEFLSQLF